MSLTQLAIAAVLAHPAVTAPIVGVTRPEQLDEPLAAVEKSIDAGLKARPDALTYEYRLGDDIR